MVKTYTVYCLLNNVTKERYIGLTSRTLNQRIKSGKGYKPNTKINKAIEKYGLHNFDKIILFTTSNKEKAENKEKFYIHKYNTIDNGYNKQRGGYKSTGYAVDIETRNKLSNILKGKHCSLKTEFKKGIYYESSRNKKQQVLCIDTNTIYSSIVEAEKETAATHITDVCKGFRNTSGGYGWRYIKEE